jgi:hypothetical protein
MEYKARKGVCAACRLRASCTKAKERRTVKRHEKQWALEVAPSQAHSRAARRDRQRRHDFMERSFVDASNNHYFKRARWRRLWRQQIRDYLIAAIQNVRILLAQGGGKRKAVALTVLPPEPSGSLGFLPHRSASQHGSSSADAISFLHAALNLPDSVGA